MSSTQVGSASSAPQVLGWETVAYSAALLARSRLLGDACGYTTATGELPGSAATLIAAIGERDVASGLAMALVARGTPLRLAIAVRVAADLSDAVIFGVGLRGATLWGVACTVSARAV